MAISSACATSKRDRVKIENASDEVWSIVGEVTINSRCFLILGHNNADESAKAPYPPYVSNGDVVRPGVEYVRFDLLGFTCVAVEVDNEARRGLTDLLTARELQIAMLVATGERTKRIAHRLQISEWTVTTHLRRIYAKLGVENRAAMVYRCLPLLERCARTSRF